MPRMGTELQRFSGLADALFSRTQQRVLGLLFGQPDRKFMQQQLIMEAAAGSGGVRRELDRLERSGLVSVYRVGAQKHYQANRNAPIFDELRGIVVKTVGLTDPLRDALRRIRPRVQLAMVFGSIARGEDHVDSDIDLLVVADDLPLERLFSRLEPLEKRLGRKINPTFYSTREYTLRRERSNPFLKKVLAGPRILLVGDPDAVTA